MKVLTDNATSVHSANNMGGCISLSCNSELRKIWDWVIMRNNFIMPARILGIMNIEADAE